MRRLLCPLLGLLNRRRSSFDNGIEFVVIDDTRVIEQFRLQTHQPGRHLIPDRKDQIDIQAVTHTSSAFRGREPVQPVYSKMFRDDGGMEPAWSGRHIFFCNARWRGAPPDVLIVAIERQTGLWRKKRSAAV